MNHKNVLVATRALVMLSFSLTGARVFAQTVPTKTLSKPVATFAEPFTQISGVREQSDGRVVVLDRLDVKILRIDFAKGTATQLGRTGKGPGEYTMPIVLAPLPGDSTLAVDMMGGGRAIVITRDAVSGTPLRAKGFENNKPLFDRPEVQFDLRGRLYQKVDRYRAENGKLMRTDSAGVRRLDRATGVQDTIGMLYTKVRSPLLHPVPSKGAATNGDKVPAARGGGSMPPFSSVDQWAVALDGRVAVVSLDPYRVTFYGEDGKATSPVSIPFTPVKMSAALKQHWEELSIRPRPSITFGPGGSAGGRTVPKYEEPDEWPDVLPPFLFEAVLFAPDGNLWVERATAANAPPTFDVIDRAGRVASRVVLPVKSRLVGLGKGTVYLVRIDDDDLEHLEKHVLPP